MNRIPSILLRFAGIALLLLFVLASGPSKTLAQSKTFTLDADFDEGTIVNLNHDAPNPNQLQLNTATRPFPFINVAASDRGTMIRLDTETGAIIGEYRTAPGNRPKNPSRTTVDLFGEVWLTNRDESEGNQGSAIKVGLVIGGTRQNLAGDLNPNGEYLAGPFDYNTCLDRDGDGRIHTSHGLGNILPWSNAGGVDDDGGVETASDECILLYVRLPNAPNARHVSVDADNNVWIGGFPYNPTWYHKVNGATGAIMDSFNASAIGCGGYGGLVDGNGILWSASLNQHAILRYDPATHTGACIGGVPTSYGTGVDGTGHIWNSTWTNNQVAKFTPGGAMVPGFPKPSGGSGSRGVAVTPDDNVWIANSYSNTVTRLDNDGNVLKTIGVGSHPTGVAVDAAGKVWVTNYYSSDVYRIDPTAGGDGLGEVDLTVGLGGGAGPYNYSDMTGSVAIGATAPQGTWTVVFDGGADGIDWGVVSWNALVPTGAGITVQVRADDAHAGLSGHAFVPVASGVGFTGSGVTGRYIEVQTTLLRGTSAQGPVLYDLSVGAEAVDLVPPVCRIQSLVSGPPMVLSVLTQDVGSGIAGIDVLMAANADVFVPPFGAGTTDPVVVTAVKINQSARSTVALRVTDAAGNVVRCDPVATDLASDVPDVFELEQNYPNPFNPSTTLRYAVAEEAQVHLRVFDVTGRLVTTLVDGPMTPGTYEVVWNGQDNAGRFVPSGIYLVRYEAGSFRQSRSMILSK